MAKTIVLNIKLDADDEARLVWLARRVQRTKADTVRWLIREATGGPNMTGRQSPYTLTAPQSPKTPLSAMARKPLTILSDWEEWGSALEDEEGQ